VHDLDHLGMDTPGRPGSGGTTLVLSRGGPREERLGYLRAAGVLDANEEDATHTDVISARADDGPAIADPS
jgi:hypothetical protein